MAQQKAATPAPSGLWHLLAADEKEEVIPQHRMDIRLYPSPAPLRAAIVNRVTGEDMPYSTAEFDGTTLRLGRRIGQAGSEDVSWLQMKWDGVRFVGGYVDGKGNSIPGAVPLKLIRSKQ